MKNKSNYLQPLILCVVLALGVTAARGDSFATAGNAPSAHNWNTSYAGVMAESGLTAGYDFQLGALRIRPHIGLWGGYDNNVYLAPEGEDKVEDFYYGLGPGLMLQFGRNENYLMADYVYELFRYDEQVTEDYESQFFTLAGHTEFGKSIIHISDIFRDTDGASLEAGQRLSKIQNVAAANYEYLLSKKTSGAALGTYEIHDYKDDAYIDYDEYRLGGRVYYRAFQKTDIFGDYTRGWVDLSEPKRNKEPDLSVEQSYGDAVYDEISIGARSQVTRKSSMTGRVGYQHREFEDDIEPIDDWTMAVQANSQVSSRLSLGIDASRRILPSSTRSGYSVVTSRVGGHLRRFIYKDNISLALGGALERGKYYDTDAQEVRDDDYWAVNGMLDWKCTQHMSLGLGYMYSENTSSDQDFTIDRSEVMIRANANY